MKKLTTLTTLILTLCTLYSFAGDSTRVIVKTKDNGVYVSPRIRSNNKQLLYYVNDETTPFTGKVIEFNYAGKKIQEQSFRNGFEHGEYISWNNSESVPFIMLKANYCNGKLCGDYTEWFEPNQKSKICSYDNNGELHGKLILLEGKDTSTVKFYNHGKEVPKN